jgi:hypothetical protein
VTGALTDRGADIALDAVTGRTAAAARTMYLCALTADPTRTGTMATMTEYAATGYARQAYTPSAPATSGNNRLTNNTNTITFGPLTGATGAVAITHLALVSAATGTAGDLVARWAVDASRSPAAGDSISVAISGVSASLAVTPLA